MSLIMRVRIRDAQIEIARRALWHYSKWLSWNPPDAKSEGRNLFNISENQVYGHIIEADQIARIAIQRMYDLESMKWSQLMEFKMKPWDAK